MKKILLGFSLLVSFLCTGQDQPVFSQFTLNPFQFNPSYAAYNGYSEANVFFRKQWMNIENAPTVGAFNIQLPVGQNVSLGLTVISNKTVLLTTNSALATFAYRVRLGSNHHLNFGLSAGMASNNFNAEEVASDPIFANSQLRNSYVTGQFGLNYRYKNFNIGFALPSLLDSRPISSTEFQSFNLDPFKNKFASASYNFNFSKFQLTPIMIYRALDNEQTQWESMVMATYKNAIWLGVSYREGYGLTGIVGIRLRGNYRISYAYEYPTSLSTSSASNLASHEFFLGARIGQHDREEQYAKQEEARKDALAKAKEEEAKAEQAKAEQAKAEAEQKARAEEKTSDQEVQPEKLPAEEVTKTEPELQQPAKQEEEQPTQTPVLEETKPQTVTYYYVVVGAYQYRQNAMNQMRNMINLGLTPQLVYVKEKQLFYVCLTKSESREQALEELIKERDRNRFPGAWLYKQQETKK